MTIDGDSPLGPPTDGERLVLFTIYDHPVDHPDDFVVRRWECVDGKPVPRQAVGVATLEEARAILPPGLYNLGREPDDDARIVETWI